MIIMKSILLLCTLISLGLSQTDDCPNPVECLINPCDNTICPRFLNANCVSDNCNGECKALFIHGRHNTMINIDDCEVPTCDQTQCPSQRICMDEAFPANCPIDQPNCRRIMKPVCELPPRIRPPSDCSVVTCGPDMSCQLYERRNGPEARCVPFKPSTCEELGPCDLGMECRHRPRGNNKHPVVRCVPIYTIVRKPRDCTQLECQDGFACMLFGLEGRQRARCVLIKPTDLSCEELNCEAGGLLCDRSGAKPMCRSPTNCDEAICSEDRVCSILNIPDVPQEFRCPFRQARCKLDIINKLKGGRILVCRDRTLSIESCDTLECPDDKVCGGKVVGEQHISVCVPKVQVNAVRPVTTCDITTDDFCSEQHGCIHFNQNGYSGFAHCTEINCQESTCSEDEDTCISSNERVLSESGIGSSCSPTDRVALIQDNGCSDGRVCSNNMTTCTDTFINNVLIGTVCIPPFALPTLSCEDASCSVGEMCTQDVINGQVVRASCADADFLAQLLGALTETLQTQ